MKNAAPKGGAILNSQQIHNTQSAIKNQAIALAEQGLPVFSCNSDKSPACVSGFKSASRDPNEITRMFDAAPNATCIGIPTGSASGISVLDVDPEGISWLEENAAKLPATYSYQTPRGGRHIWFRHREGIRCSAGKIARGVDVRGDGGYVIFHPANGFPVISHAPLAAWPEWLVPIESAKPELPATIPTHVSQSYAQAALKAAIENVRSAPEGERNSTLNKEAHGVFRLIAALSAPLVMAELTQAARACGLPEHEINRTLQSAAKARGIDLSNLSNQMQYPSIARAGFSFTRADDVPDTKQIFLVDGIIPEHSLCMFFGASGGGKTFGALSMGYAIACGTPWYGHNVKNGPVAYICGEGKAGIRKRLLALSAYHGRALDGIPLYISSGAADFSDPMSLQAVQAAIEALDVPPALIIVDTLSRNNSADENDSAAMAAFIKALDNLKDKYAASVLIVHHTGHSDKDRARGSSVLKAALDAEFRVDKSGARVTFTCTKMKDAEEPPTKHFELQSVPVSVNGELERSAVLALINETFVRLPPQSEKALGILRSYGEALDEGEFLSLLVADRVINSSNPDSQKRSFREIIKLLTGASLVIRQGEKIHLTEQTDQSGLQADQGRMGADYILPAADGLEHTPKECSVHPKGV